MIFHFNVYMYCVCWQLFRHVGLALVYYPFGYSPVPDDDEDSVHSVLLQRWPIILGVLCFIIVSFTTKGTFIIVKLIKRELHDLSKKDLALGVVEYYYQKIQLMLCRKRNSVEQPTKQETRGK
jgi:hypothetical protein